MISKKYEQIFSIFKLFPRLLSIIYSQKTMKSCNYILLFYYGRIQYKSIEYKRYLNFLSSKNVYYVSYKDYDKTKKRTATKIF